MTKRSKGWIIIPCFNESGTLKQALDRIVAALPFTSSDFTLCVVDDGSSDQTFEVARELATEYPSVAIKIIKLSRNFGKEAAIEAGLEACSSDYSFVIVLDADLEHPPELIPEMIRNWKLGYLSVHAIKKKRQTESLFYKLLALLFYNLFNKMSGLDIRNHTDFKLLDYSAVQRYIELPEKKKFFRGLTVWTGGSNCTIEFNVGDAVAGHTSSWKLLDLLAYAISSVISFSSKPLQIFASFGLMVFFVGFVLAIVSIGQKFAGVAVDGFTTVIVLLVLLSGTIIFGVGLLGLYLSIIFEEIKQRPSHIVEEIHDSRSD